MKIVDIRDAVVPIASQIRNAYIDFSRMTVSVIALVTDVIRDGGPVVPGASRACRRRRPDAQSCRS